MGQEERLADIEVLARMAARMAGRDPNQHVKCQLGAVVAFEGEIWRYPDFLDRAEAAYRALDRDNPLKRELEP